MACALRPGWLATVPCALLLSGAAAAQSLSTADHVTDPGWWPTKSATARADFVGADACIGCHKRAASELAAGMGRAAVRLEGGSGAALGRDLDVRPGRYTYRIAREKEGLVYSVGDGKTALRAVLQWAFGDGHVGQSYLWEEDGGLREARVSYYGHSQALDFTPGRALREPHDAKEAMARAVDPGEVRRCFACHTTGAIVGERLDLAAAIPGVTCEACHGPGRAHVDAVQNTPPHNAPGLVFNPKGLDPAALVDFCGACHGAFWDVTSAGLTGVPARRAQPYRLQGSRCWEQGRDARLACIACHNPHQPLVHDAAAYDERCLACHVPKGASPTARLPGRACTVATENCVTCHMPKFDAPEMHASFTDHKIQIVRAPAAAGGGR